MKFTFGIVTGGDDSKINKVIDSIELQNIPEYEIIVVGGNNVDRKNTTHIPFDETIKPMWITKKKNLITENAKYDNVVYMHDYVYLCDGWYKGFLQYGNDFKVCMNRIVNANGSRFRDWTLWAEDADVLGVPPHQYFLPYNILSLSKYMYFSGAYWVAKKSVMDEFPLDENRIWGQGEDVEWSKQIRKHHNFSMNALSSVKLMKQKDPAFYDISNEQLLKLINIK